MVKRRGRANRQPLAIWMNGEHVGVWGRTSAGIDTLQYDDAWIASSKGRPLSLTLNYLPGNEPHSGQHVSAWFENLLPDSDEILRRIGKRFNVAATPRSLLEKIGRDCVGAVQILPIDELGKLSKRVEATKLSNGDVARMLRGVTSSGAIGQSEELGDPRISIAGAQEKTALLRYNDGWYLPEGSTPSTHIFKLPLGLVGSMRYNFKDSVENEWLCLQILKELGFDVANAEIATFQDRISDERVLVVERFDRDWAPDNSHLIRLPQEDLCQATGRAPRQKYENEGGPGVIECMDLLRTGLDPENDVRTFALSQLAFWLLAAIDGHAKNFSIFLNRNGYLMTPLYDVISAWPIIGKGPDKIAIQDAKLAMALRGKSPHRKLHEIKTRHWKGLADQSGLRDAFDSMIDLVHRVPDALQAVERELPHAFPQNVWLTIAEGLTQQCRRFDAGMSDPQLMG